MHIVNHLYFENQRKQGERNPTVIFENCFASQGTRIVIPHKNPDDCQIFFFFAILLHILLKNLKRKKQSFMCWLFHWSLRLWSATFEIQHRTFSSQSGRVEKKTVRNYTCYEASPPDRLYLTSIFLILTSLQPGSSLAETCL